MSEDIMGVLNYLDTEIKRNNGRPQDMRIMVGPFSLGVIQHMRDVLVASATASAENNGGKDGTANDADSSGPEQFGVPAAAATGSGGSNGGEDR
jgi:hypothetical protein